jgi:flagellar hook-associated protein FlgK
MNSIEDVNAAVMAIEKASGRPMQANIAVDVIDEINDLIKRLKDIKDQVADQYLLGQR